MKKKIKKTVRKLIKRLPVRYAEELVWDLEKQIGIGGGGEVSDSGEAVVFDLLKRLNPGRPITVFDVGANLGQYAHEAVSRLGDGCEYQIHCFEPSKKTFDRLAEAHAGNSRVTVNHCGISDTQKTATLYMNAEASGLASLIERDLGHFGIDHGKIKEEVKLDTLLHYCGEKGIEEIQLLKIDVEGHEFDVLSGAKPMLESKKIDLVQFEFGGTNIDARTYYKDFFAFFEELGYELFRIIPSCRLLHLPSYKEADEKFQLINFVAARKSLEVPKRFGDLVV